MKAISITNSKLKAIIIFLVALLAVVTACFAQPDSLWSRTYGGTGTDAALSVALTTDGGYVLGGATQSSGAGSDDAWMIKTNADGDTLWCRTFGGAQSDGATYVGQTADGGYFIAGMTFSYGVNGDFWLIKTDSVGSTVWSRTYGGPGEDYCGNFRGHGQQTADGGYILTGYTTSFGAGGRDFWLVKTNANGDSLWTQTFGGPLLDQAHYVVQTADGGYIVAGMTYSFGDGSGDFWLVKTDANGNSLWSHTYGKRWEDGAWCVRETMDGGYVVVGHSNSSNGLSDVWLVKTSADGDSLWSVTYGELNRNEAGLAILQTSDSGYVIAGYNDYPDGDLLLIRTNGYGNVLWERTFGGPAWEGAYEIQLTPDGGYIISGMTYSFGAGNGDAWLIKTGPDPVSAVHPEASNLYPANFNLLQNYPNPFNPITEISYSIPQAGAVSLRVYDILGRQIAVLVDGFSTPGTYRTTFDGTQLSSGIYFVLLQAGNLSQTCKMVLLK
jgi:hypothetical protein